MSVKTKEGDCTVLFLTAITVIIFMLIFQTIALDLKNAELQKIKTEIATKP